MEMDHGRRAGSVQSFPALAGVALSLQLAHLARVTCAAISPSYDHQVTADSSRNHNLPTIRNHRIAGRYGTRPPFSLLTHHYHMVLVAVSNDPLTRSHLRLRLHLQLLLQLHLHAS